MAAETKQFSGPVPRKLHTLLSHTSHNVRFKQTFLHFNVLAKKKLFKMYDFAQNKEYFGKTFFTREVAMTYPLLNIMFLNRNGKK